MKYIVRYFILAVLVALTYAQEFYFGSFGGNAAGALQRDPRQNRGPVVFPPSPAYDGGSSGVIVGASGYGFVPPGSQGLGSSYPQRPY